MKLNSLWVKSPKLRVYHIVVQHKITKMQETIKTKAKSRKDAMDFGPKYMGKNYEIVSCKLYNYDPEAMKIKRKRTINYKFLAQIKEKRKAIKFNRPK